MSAPGSYVMNYFNINAATLVAHVHEALGARNDQIGRTVAQYGQSPSIDEHPSRLVERRHAGRDGREGRSWRDVQSLNLRQDLLATSSAYDEMLKGKGDISTWKCS